MNFLRIFTKTPVPAIPVILCIDVEPDEMFPDRSQPKPWTGFEQAHLFFSELRPRIAAATGSPAHFSWFYRLDPQVAETYGSGDWPLNHYSARLQEFEKHGDEIGIHTHFYRFDETARDWRIENRDPQWPVHCVGSSCEVFRKLYGRNPGSHRFGDRFVTDAALDVVEQSGCRFDLSVEPGFNEPPPDFIRNRITGALPDMTGAPSTPYRRSRADFRKADPGRPDALWMIPLGTGHCRRNPGNPLGSRQLFPLHLSLDEGCFRQIVAQQLRARRPYLGIVLRTDMLNNPHLVGMMRNNLKHLMTSPHARQMVFSTPAEALEILGCR
jgi:hypothetical protein